MKLKKMLETAEKNLQNQRPVFPFTAIIGQEEIDKEQIKFKVIQGQKNSNEFTTTKEQLVNEIRKFI